jgi:hypothetical protein
VPNFSRFLREVGICTVSLDIHDTKRYRSSMFMRHSQAEINKLERQSASWQKERGKRRFIWREVIGSVLMWLIVLPSAQVLANHGSLLTGNFPTAWLIMLPIFLLGGYLTGRWKWQDLEKKYQN